MTMWQVIKELIKKIYTNNKNDIIKFIKYIIQHIIDMIKKIKEKNKNKNKNK